MIVRAKQTWVQYHNGSLTEQKQGIRLCMEVSLLKPPQGLATSGVSAPNSSADHCMCASISAEELHI